jgi:hypothetical protein
MYAKVIEESMMKMMETSISRSVMGCMSPNPTVVSVMKD